MLDAISQEAALAALKFLQSQFRLCKLSAMLHSAVLLVMHDDESINSYEKLAKRMRVSTGNLHKHWNREGLHALTLLTLKEFLDLVLLLKVRARLTPRLKVGEVAQEYNTTKKHMQATYKCRVGPWRDRDRGGWLALPRLVRSWDWSGLRAAA